jgi:hypothetical protein
MFIKSAHGANTIILFTDIIYEYCNKLECLSLARLTHKLRLGWKALLGTNTLAYFDTTVSHKSQMLIKLALGANPIKTFHTHNLLISQ